MSRFEIDKFIRHTDNDGARIAAFAADPAGYVDGWVERGAQAAPRPVDDGGRLTEAERASFIDEDYQTLYAMGAHPYLLFHFVLAVDMARGATAWPEFVDWYRSMVTPHGRPDFTT
jgi:hypothetical protein